MDQSIKERVSKHQATHFPKGYRGEDIEGIDLVMLDADTAACVLSYISDNGKLDICRIAILGRCYRDLSVVITKLDDREARAYFKEWEIIAGMVLMSIIKDNKKLL